ncbi:o-succinylbenzoate--CoA ligase [Loigolactobacillus rennini]|uniref:2-succinylbenzoate--CoA ligase n=1 Tax=Loigolactobacillus rennini DSM 20253 TaxID=1423796 RepID=A0A0R2D5E9_9LACO|nr:o-succinylbenzoate--CoA ligase [Loigolactobacillus rennini]KRM99311.1 O-succinylbenzoic acid--CoA ligase [Loigolactobacillus rennini DSM 20253]
MENWLSKRARLTPNRCALKSGAKQLTFFQLQAQVLQQAGRIASLQPRKRVAILTDNTMTGYLTILAVQQLGLEPVLLNWRLATNELNQQLNDAAVDLCLAADRLAQPLAARVISFSQLSQQTPVASTPVAEFPPNGIASIMYTSGTSGRAKGVLQTYRNHFFSAMGSVLNLGLTETDSWLCCVPLFHISGLSIMMRSLIYGMTVVLVDHFDATTINQLLCTQPITTISVVPYMLKKLLAQLPTDKHYNAAFRCMLLGGGAIDRETLTHCQQRQIPVIQSYGMTETASQIVALNFASAEQKIGSAGQPLFPVQIKITPENATNGHILIKTPTLAAGYLNQMAAFKQHFQHGWFDTGDIGYLDAEGFLFVTGRSGDMINSGGENMFPAEIETVYQQHPAVQQIVVAGQSDPTWGSVPVAYLQLNQPISAAELQQYGRQHLAHYKVPHAFYQVESFPRTGNGKVKRRALTPASGRPLQ